ncbi:hypothetical protein ADUPG1_007732 [Aduncisulcus paluster]|uniref:Uncharacterized protein n=1 Tax=Aduncisulcus paluster TaxID=2918883 RepID=A0ABQ5KPB8_9EUKA|nr:hypothetical protein ADUPG1_007732 [Aduncisulcus paluster]
MLIFVFIINLVSFSQCKQEAASYWAFGDNSNYQYGNNNTISFQKPSLVSCSDCLYDFVQIEGDRAGTFFVALDSVGGVWSWGDNSRGQLGINSVINQTQPTEIPPVYFNLEGVVRISVGTAHVVALTVLGNIYTWGDNSFYQLGYSLAEIDGDVPTYQAFPSIVDSLTSNKIKTISSLPFSNVIVADSGEVFCWGLNEDDENTENSKLVLCGISSGSHTYDHIIEAPTLVPIPESALIVSAHCGDDFVVVISEKGVLYGWGNNKSAQFDPINRGIIWQEATKMSIDDITSDDVIVRCVQVGRGHTILALSNNRIYGTGGNDWGQLCLNPGLEQDRPWIELVIPNNDILTTVSSSAISDPSNHEIEAFDHTLTTNNESTETSNHNTVYVSRHTLIFTGSYSTMVQIPAGPTYACGENDLGQLGVSSSINVISSPNKMLFDDDVVISCILQSDTTSLALLEDNSLYVPPIAIGKIIAISVSILVFIVFWIIVALLWIKDSKKKKEKKLLQDQEWDNDY